ncbi:MAG: hypothetical protein HY089_12235 [Ignavibacteriales bacterium]|nr:hypothetical protein [Ignavibacteriales bacterium]
MAHGSERNCFNQQRIVVAISFYRENLKRVAGCFAFLPQPLFSPAPENRFSFR